MAVWLGAFASTAVVVTTAVIALAAAGPESAWLAGVALGLSVGAAASGLEATLTKGVAAGFVSQAALRLAWPGATRGSALVAGALFLALAVGGWLKLRRRKRRRVARAAGAVAGLSAAAGLLGVLAAAEARPLMEAGVRDATQAVSEARRGDTAASARLLDQATRSFGRARGFLESWWARPAFAVPMAAQQVRTLAGMARSGAALSSAASQVTATADLNSLKMEKGALPLDRISSLGPPARQALSALVTAEASLGTERSPWLLPPVSTRLSTLSDRVRRARGDAEVALMASELAPTLLGRERPRRYFLAIQTPSELRASGGLIGNFGEISADRGRLKLERIGRTADLNTGGDPKRRRLLAPPDYVARYARFDVDLLWQNITMSPDFPTVGRAIAGLYPQSGGRPIDGVIAIDPLGLAAVLKATGPVQVRGWPVPITADNAAAVLLYEQYVRLAGDARVDFLGSFTEAVWQRLTTGSADLVGLAEAVAPMVAQKHLMLASTRPEEEAALQRRAIAGAMAPVQGDFLGVVTQNAGGNKIDWFLRRSTRYEARVDPGSGEIRSTARITLRNEAPAGGLPDYIIGSSTTPRLPTGANKAYLSVYTPWLVSAARLDGKPLLVESELELGRRVYSTYVTVPPGGSSMIELDLVGRMDMTDGYRLDFHRQPFLAADDVAATVRVPDGWGVGRSAGRRHLKESFPLVRDATLRASLRKGSALGLERLRSW